MPAPVRHRIEAFWTVIVASLLASLAGPVVAQDRFLVAGPPQLSTLANLLLFTQDGSAVTTLARLPQGLLPTHGVMDDRNHGFVLTAANPSSVNQSSILHLDPGGKITSLVTGSPLSHPQGIVLDEQGAWFVLDEDLGKKELRFFRFSGSGSPTPVGSPANLSVRRVGFDPDSGQAVLFASDPNLEPCVVRVDPRNGAITSFTGAQLPSSLFLATAPVYDPESGALLTASQGSSNYPTLFKITPERGMTPLTTVQSPGWPILMSDLGRQSPAAAVFGLVLWPRYGTSPLLLTLTRTGKTISTRSLPKVPSPDPHFIVRQGRRNLAPVTGLGPGRAGLNVAFPRHAGRSYVVGLSAMGMLPALPLQDGRVIPIAFDMLTVFSIFGGVPGVMMNTVGVLDSTGRASMTLDLRIVGQAFRGLRLAACAVVLDPAAPNGLAEISLPIGITVP